MRPCWNLWLACCFFLAGICLLAWGAALYFTASPASTLEVADTDVEIIGHVLGTTQEVVLRLENNTDQPMRVLGLSLC